MTFASLALIGAAALLGPLLAAPAAWRIPVVTGELLAGLVLGVTGFGWLDATDPTFTLLADVGFALVMFVAGSHVPIRDPVLRGSLLSGAARAAAVGVVAAGFGVVLADVFDTGHAALYGVLMASSSAALILPIVDAQQLSGPAVTRLIPQIAIADTVCIVALPLVLDRHRVGPAALGALAVAAGAVALFLGLRALERSGIRRRVHRLSERRGFALELRVSLVVLFALAAVATATHVSIMLAGFSAGLAVAAVGEPRRLARQVFAVTEGFLGPLFFVWLGASLPVRDLARHPTLIVLGVLLGLGAIAAHAVLKIGGQPLPLGVLAAAQLGVPVAAATLATQQNLLTPGEAPALLLGALVTIAAATVASGLAARRADGRPTP